jgi:ATP-dependent helicase/nuclease subunit B
MSRPMMKRFGLPAPERSTGLSAHDFAQGFCARDVVLTRARRVDGTPAVPARWLQRLDTVLQALKIDPKEITREGERWLNLVRRMDRAEKQNACARPAPAPPVNLRPRELSATRIETWMADPYSIYARYVLKLKKLDALEKAPDAADRGDFLHHVMDRFVKDHPAALPADAAKKVVAYGSDHLARRADDPGFWDFWWPRFERLANWTAAHEQDWRKTATPVKTEVSGQMTLGNFTLTAKADRIDRLSDGSYAIIDYKSGGAFSKSKIASGESPQLPLEGLIAQAGGFEGITAGSVGWLGYWVMTGGEPPGDVECLNDNIDDALADTRAGLEALITLYDNAKTPYYAIPDPDRAPRYNDYEQLARVQEWTALGEAGSEEAA